MLLPTAHCPSCDRPTLVYRALPEAPEQQNDLETRCVDCDTRLDRFGLAPVVAEQSVEQLSHLGYRDLDRPEPVGLGGCFTTRGCEGCSKIDSRPW